MSIKEIDDQSFDAIIEQTPLAESDPHHDGIDQKRSHILSKMPNKRWKPDTISNYHILSKSDALVSTSVKEAKKLALNNGVETLLSLQHDTN